MHADHGAAVRAAADRFAAELWAIAGPDALRLPPASFFDLIAGGLVDRLCASTAADAGATGAPDPEAIAKQVEGRYTGIMYLDLKPFAGADLATYAVAHLAWRRVRDGRRPHGQTSSALPRAALSPEDPAMNPDVVHTVRATEGGFHIIQGGHPVDDIVYTDAVEVARRCAYLNHVEAHYYTVLTGVSRIVVALLAAGVHRLDAEALVARALDNIGVADERNLRAFAVSGTVVVA